eukprot:SAG25_NODE_37_length_19691_cov_19.319467_22_plen_65_part_00
MVEKDVWPTAQGQLEMEAGGGGRAVAGFDKGSSLARWVQRVVAPAGLLVVHRAQGGGETSGEAS